MNSTVDQANENIQPRQTVDLTNCDREPIHVPAAIQPHGLLLALSEDDFRVQQISRNALEFAGIDAFELLGNPLARLLGAAQESSFAQTLNAADLRASNPMKLKIGTGEKARLVNGIVHRHMGILFLELEPVGEPIEAPLRAFQLFQSAMLRIQKTTSLPQLWRVVVEEVKAILQYDRVMVYKFDRSSNGSVIEEEVVEGREQYRGLHYPASDIPQQARRLYTLNGIRHIPDVNYKPADLIPLIFPSTRDLTDLSYSTLRSVSPIHIEYLQNMGVQASLSVSLLSGSSLWGLIACHNYTPKFIPYEMRSACEMLGQVVALRMIALQAEEENHYKSKTNSLQATFLGELSRKIFKDALMDGTPTVMDYIPCGGAVLWAGKDCYSLGKTPSPEQIEKIIRRVRRHASPVFATDHLSALLSEAKAFKDVTSGVLSITISREQDIYLIWMRPEQVQVVNWSGDPAKSAEPGDAQRLHPRKSFALWKEVVEEKSMPWTDGEIQSATELRSTLMGLIIKRI
jgi:light-regulated signal transduction histidine kinase (bacteriophytochrome)